MVGHYLSARVVSKPLREHAKSKRVVERQQCANTHNL